MSTHTVARQSLTIFVVVYMWRQPSRQAPASHRHQVCYPGHQDGHSEEQEEFHASPLSQRQETDTLRGPHPCNSSQAPGAVGGRVSQEGLDPERIHLGGPLGSQQQAIPSQIYLRSY